MPSDLPNSVDLPVGLDPSRLDIETRSVPFDELLSRIGEGELDVRPLDGPAQDWTVSAKSRLIESVLIRVPLPAFYIDSVDERRWVTIDGRHRLSAIWDFCADKGFALTGLEYLTELEGQGYDDLARALKRRLGETAATLALVKPGVPMAVRGNLFRRINPRRTSQQVRDALIGGAAAALIDTLANGADFLEATGIGAARDTDREAVLRFLTFFPVSHPPTFAAPLDSVLTESMEALNAESLDGLLRRDLFGRRFRTAMATAGALFDGRAFCTQNEPESEPTAPNPALCEVWSVVLARLDAIEAERLLARREEVIKAFTVLLHDRDFAAATAPGIDDPDSVRKRFAAVHDLVGQFVSA